MISKLVWFYLIVLAAYQGLCAVLPGNEYYESYGSDESAFEELQDKERPFRVIQNMIKEAKTIVNGVLEGNVPADMKNEMESTESGLRGFCDDISEAIKKWLEEIEAKAEEIEAAKRCIEEAAEERKEEAAAGMADIAECVKAAMVNAAVEGAPLFVVAQLQAKATAILAKEIGKQLYECSKKHDKKFKCMKEVWLSAQQNITQLKEQAKELLRVASELYKEFRKEMKICILTGAQLAADLERNIKVDVLECLKPDDNDPVIEESFGEDEFPGLTTTDNVGDVNITSHGA